MVSVSVPALVVSVMFAPATTVSVSVGESATILLCPATAIVSNRFCVPVVIVTVVASLAKSSAAVTAAPMKLRWALWVRLIPSS